MGCGREKMKDSPACLGLSTSRNLGGRRPSIPKASECWCADVGDGNRRSGLAALVSLEFAAITAGLIQ